MVDDHGKLRISDADRGKAIEQLQQALDEGRIDLGEFDERSKAAYEAKTNAELDLIFDDLPVSRADDRSVNTIDLTPEERAEREAAVRERAHWGDLHSGSAVRWLIWVACTTIPIWLFVSISTGEMQYFWPMWPLLGVGCFAVMQLMRRRGRGC